MSEPRFKKASRPFVMSDSSVNELGFRLDTKGYQQAEFERNPIGFKQHDRQAGVLMRWEDIAVDGDKIVGTPVINLAHPAGQQVLDEIENGFLNAASMGYFVFLEVSDEAALKLEGQVGPTITKWYNKECSVVDIPGNANALKLYGGNGEEITLADLMPKKTEFINNDMDKLTLTPEAARGLLLAAGSHETAVINAAIVTLAAKADAATARADKAEGDLAAEKTKQTESQVTDLLKSALDGQKITVALSAQLGKDYAGKPEALKTLLEGMGAYTSVTADIQTKAKEIALKYAGKTWDDLMEGGLAGKCQEEAPELYKAIRAVAFAGK